MCGLRVLRWYSFRSVPHSFAGQRFKQKFKAFGVTWLVKRPSDVRSAGRLQLDNKVVPPMTCQSSEPPDAIQQHDRRADSDPRAEDSDENRIASAMKDLKNTGRFCLFV